MKSSYENKVNWLFNQFPAFQKVGEVAYKPTLDNTKKLIQHLQVPLEEMRFVHVAGTNGKGTTCAIRGASKFKWYRATSYPFIAILAKISSLCHTLSIHNDS